MTDWLFNKLLSKLFGEDGGRAKRAIAGFLVTVFTKAALWIAATAPWFPDIPVDGIEAAANYIAVAFIAAALHFIRDTKALR